MTEMRRTKMKMSILSLAVGIVLASPVAAYASENANLIEGLFYGLDHSHQTTDHATVVAHLRDPFKPRTTDGLSSDPNACASYGCVERGGGGD
jgi:hypothetical protein